MVSATRKQLDTRRFHHNTGQLFADQYYHIYNARLKASREALMRNSRYRWGNDIENLPLEQLNASLGSTDVFVIGTLFKLMPKQPSILRELEVNNNEIITNEGPNVNFTSDEDTLVLHETDENVKVVGEIDTHMHVTGIPVSLKGYQLNGGAFFHVTDMCYAGPDLSVYKPLPEANSYKNESVKGQRIVIVSGMEFGFHNKLEKEKVEKVINGLKKLRQYILAEDVIDYEISKVIIAGNSIGPGYTKAQIELQAAAAAAIDNSNSQSSKPASSLCEVFGMFDKYIHSIAQSGAKIHIMPGKNDPSSFLLPQQPIHPKILPQSGQLVNVEPETNPCLIEYKDLVILGTSGENIEAIMKFSKIIMPISALRSTLEWGHMAPLAPDNLSCVPFKENDPFIIDFEPDVYFAANQPEFTVTTYSTDSKKKIQLISVPTFVNTLSCVMIDLEKLEVELISFDD